MAQSSPSLVGSVLERKPSSKPAPPLAVSENGFPTVQHRSKSAFARAREQSQKRVMDVPVVKKAQPHDVQLAATGDQQDDWRAQVEEDNRRRVEAMTDEEREQGRMEILRRFGPNVGDILRQAREAREATQRAPGTQQVDRATSAPGSPRSKLDVEDDANNISDESSPRRRLDERTKLFTSMMGPSFSPPTSANSTRPPSRSDRKIRFADLTPSDIHVYESAPPSPRRKALALPPPSDADGPTISLGKWKPSPRPRRDPEPSDTREDDNDYNTEKVGDFDEGTPEDIRRRFFPTSPANDPSLQWIHSAPESEPEPESVPTIRFDLNGNPIPAQLSASLPTHLGLHHHAEGSHAGYTIEDIFLLSRSTVPGQRATMLAVLAKIAHKLALTSRDKQKGIPELAGQELALRKRMLATGVEAMGERTSVGARAVELIWECLAQWDEEVKDVEGVELKDLDLGDAVSSLPLDFVLPQVASAFAVADSPKESLSQLLSILHRLAQHSNDNATAIVSTKGLVANIFQTFLLTPIPPSSDSSLPNPIALQFLRTLAASSRENASALLDPADSLLRFVITLPSSSPFPPPLPTQLVTGTLQLYATLASYGFYAHIATTAQEHLMQLGRYVRSPECRSPQIRSAWLNAVEAWTVCAHDPHKTTPSHEILWSQVVGWGWAEDLLDLRTRLHDSDEDIWTDLWNAAAAFLEGAKVNSVRGGQNERTAVIGVVRSGFIDGTERRVVNAALRNAQDVLDKLSAGMRRAILPSDVPSLRELGRHARTLSSAIRLFLSGLPESPGQLPEEPSFPLPIQELSNLCAALTKHPLWPSLYTPESIPYGHIFFRPLSTLLSTYLSLSRRIPGHPPDLWMAQAFAVLCRSFPGDDGVARRTAAQVAEAITADFLGARGWAIPGEFWENGGMKTIVSFLTHSLSPKMDHVVGPIWTTPESIASAKTQRLPPLSSLLLNDRRDQPLPLPKDWAFRPLDHLLRSGESELFKNLPSSWNASEAEVVRATLLFIRVSQEVLRDHQLSGFLMSREEACFGCMKVFMLEHGQQTDTSEEVFRDSLVERFMSELLAPFAASASGKTLKTPPPSIHITDSIDVVAKRFLGASVPFYQWYTDFVALYDAVSFAHPLFARLLLPPLSMRYPVDYRKYLWADYSHVMRTVRVRPEDIITGSVAEYLWPVETDAEVVGAYLRALVMDPLDGFVRLVAVHHVACRIWLDMGSDGEERAMMLLRAVVDQGGFDVVRDVVLYRQNREGTIVLPPACYEQQGTWKALRLEFAARCGEDIRERLRSLLED